VTREALAKLPLTRKRDLIELQKRHPPFGGLNSLSRHKAKPACPLENNGTQEQIFCPSG
jgi:hypothetical protein